MAEALFPDQVIDKETFDEYYKKGQEVLEKVKAKGEMVALPEKVDPIPALAAGFVGGLVAAKMFKSVFGVALVAGGLYWFFKQK